MKNKEKEIVSFQMEKKLKKLLDKIAEKEGRTRANLMSRIVEGYVISWKKH